MTKKTIFMSEKAFNKWIQHLTDGKITQGMGNMLRLDGSMCCLGVLEYALEGKVEPWTMPSKEFLERNEIVFLDRYGKKGTSPYLTGGPADHLNDDLKLTFEQIAQRLKSRVQFVPEKKK